MRTSIGRRVLGSSLVGVEARLGTILDDVRGGREWMSLLAAIGTISLAALAVSRSRRERGSPLLRRLAALSFVLFGWNFAVVAGHIARARGSDPSTTFGVLDDFFTAASPPMVFEMVLGFIGESRQHRGARAFTWALFGLLAVASLGSLVSSSLVGWTESTYWLLGFLGGWVLTLSYAVFLLLRYLGRASDVREKARTRIVLAALAIGGTFGMADVAHGLGLAIPYLGALGTLIVSGLFTTLVVRFDLLDRSVSATTALYVVAMTAALVVAFLAALQALAGRLGFQVFAAALVILLGAAIARELTLSLAESRARTQRLAIVGRFAAQMTHDIRGPLSALLGAVELLDGAGSEATRAEFLELVGDQARRIAVVVERYDRMARIEPVKTLVVVNEIVRLVARAHGVRDAALELAERVPECDADRALLESAVENVIRNGVEATEDPALLTVATRVEGDGSSIVIRVSDRGPGMDARTLERATEDFFSTKPNGSGLGLAFVRRVLEAHGGRLDLRSRLGHGTTVELTLPAVGRPHEPPPPAA
jgi:two-component system, NtrC family, sensor histidine kinase HydH